MHDALHLRPQRQPDRRDRRGGATAATGTVREYIWLSEAEIAPTFGSRTGVDRPAAVVSGVNATPVTYMVHVDHINRPVKMTDSTHTSTAPQT